MAVAYKLVQRKNPQNQEAPMKYYASAVTSRVSFDTLCKEIADGCTLTSADVKAVLDRANSVLDRHLSNGNIVQFGELGNFRISLSSSGSTTAEGYKSSLIRKGRIIFTPGTSLRSTVEGLTFSRASE
jgi:predicted histone-like DNA-binding protein